MTRLKVLLAGKHELACALLETLSREPAFDVATVPARSEREEDPGRRSFKRLIREMGSTHLQDGEGSPLLEATRTFRPDVLLSAGFDRIIRRDVLDSVPRCVNVHFGMLPRYRGNLSIPWAILNGEAQIGVTLHEMAQGIDDGAVVAQAAMKNDPAMSCRELYEHAVPLGVELARAFLDASAAGRRPSASAQDEASATYFPPAFPFAFRVPFRQTATFVRDYVRAAFFPPYEGAYGEIEGHRLEFLWPAEIRFGVLPGVAPGTVARADGWCIRVLNGVLVPGRVKVDGRGEWFGDACRRYGLEGKRFG